MLTVHEFYAGGGGAALGMKQAGWECIGAYEQNADACATLRKNFPGMSVFQTTLTPSTVVESRADVWWASPPCQPFSPAGLGLGEADARNGYPSVFAMYDRALSDGVAPRWLITENVKGMTYKRHEDYLRWILTNFEQRFAQVAFWRWNAADYGVPQTRERIFIIGGPAALREPEPTHSESTWITTGEALELPEHQRCWGGGHNPNKAGDRRTYRDLTDSPSTTIAAQYGGGAGNAGPFVADSPGPDWWHRNSVPAKASRTIGAKANAYLSLPEGRRRLTVRECATLQGFPKDHVFEGKVTSQYRQVGNAVPPVLARRIAEAVERADSRR